MAYDLTDILALSVSISAVAFSVAVFIISYRKGKKTEQMKVAMEISDRLDETQNKIFDIEDQLKRSKIKENLSHTDISVLERSLKDAELKYINQWEFYSFLVNNEEIDNKNIQEYFKDDFISETDWFFKKYQTYISERAFEEIKKLRHEMGHDIKEKTA